MTMTIESMGFSFDIENPTMVEVLNVEETVEKVAVEALDFHRVLTYLQEGEISVARAIEIIDVLLNHSGFLPHNTVLKRLLPYRTEVHFPIESGLAPWEYVKKCNENIKEQEKEIERLTDQFHNYERTSVANAQLQSKVETLQLAMSGIMDQNQVLKGQIQSYQLAATPAPSENGPYSHSSFRKMLDKLPDEHKEAFIRILWDLHSPAPDGASLPPLVTAVWFSDAKTIYKAMEALLIWLVEQPVKEDNA